MKHTFFVISIIGIILPCLLNAMDGPPKKDPVPIATMVKEIAHTLPRHEHNLIFTILGSNILTHENALAIITSAHDYYVQNYPNEQDTKEIFDALYAKSSSFRSAITFFQEYARKNLALLTGETLAIIEDSTIQQPITELNALPPILKKYVMTRTLDDYHDTNEFSLGHSYDIVAFDACAITHQAATADFMGKFRLWDLKTAKKIFSYNEQISIKQICFTSDGSLIAIRSNKKVKIWNPETKQVCYSLPLNETKLPIYHMCYAQETPKFLLTIYFKNYTTEGACVWQTDTTKNKYLCFHNDAANSNTQPVTIKKGIYCIENPHCQFNPTALHITKKNYHPLLLCKLAAQQTKHTEYVTKIFASQSYGQLTLCDSNAFHNELKKNPCFTSNTQSITIIEKNKKIGIS